MFVCNDNDKWWCSKIVFGLLAFLALLWLVLYVFHPWSGQKCVFFCEAETNHFYDFFVPRAVAKMSTPYVQDTYSNMVELHCVRRIIQCYPALSNYWVGLFPESVFGAISCSFIGALVYIWGLIAFFNRYVHRISVLPTVVACSSPPFLFAITVGNLILYAAGFSLAFLAWFDSRSRWRRCVAALALALASVLKITPVMLGVLYLGRDWRGQIRYVLLAAVAFAFLFFVPFLFCGGLLAWLENASMMNHSDEFAGVNPFGLYGLVVMLVRSFTMGTMTDDLLIILRVVSSIFGMVLLMAGCFLHGDSWGRGGLVVLGMLFVPPNMMCYTALYAIPFAISGIWHIKSSVRKASSLYCLSACALLQVPLFLGPVGSLNTCLSAAASIDLALVLLLSLTRWGTRS